MSMQDAPENTPQRPDTTGELFTRLAFAYGASAVAAVAMLIYGYMTGNMGVVALGGLAVVLVLAVAPVSFMSVSRNSPSGLDAATMGALLGEMRAIRGSVDRLREYQSLSDDARRVLNRAQERVLLVKAIEEDITAEDWDAAVVLCEELAGRFGYREEAEEYRQRVEQARSATRDRNVAASIAALDGLIVQRRWDHAVNHAASIQRLYPDSTRVAGLLQRVENARERYKTDLERRFLHAAQGEGVDEAMGLLKELDAYLSEEDAEPYRELARGIIGKARENLGASFKLAVRDKRWRDAARIGERIINEFPNTRMAEEVRSLIDSLRERAGSVVR